MQEFLSNNCCYRLKIYIHLIYFLSPVVSCSKRGQLKTSLFVNLLLKMLLIIIIDYFPHCTYSGLLSNNEIDSIMTVVTKIHRLLKEKRSTVHLTFGVMTN